MRSPLSVATLLLAVFVAVPLHGQIPRSLSYQGVLTDTSGTPRPDGLYPFTFRLYTSGSGGSAIWTEAKSIQVKRGLFSTTLGDLVPFPDSIRFDRQYWLGVQVGGSSEFSPRVILTGAAYSFNSLRADTARFLSRGSVVKAINNLKDSVWLLPGNNVAVSVTGDTIRISASGGGGGGLSLPYTGIVDTIVTAFTVFNNGDGSAGRFETTKQNVAQNNPALFARSAGTNDALSAVSLGNAYALNASSVNGWPGYFTISTPTNNHTALFSQTNGGGAGVFGENQGTGEAGHFEINSLTNPSRALTGITNGTGGAGLFTSSNPGSTADALASTTNGGGSAGSFTTTGNGAAGSFAINNPGNNWFALQVTTNGVGYAGSFVQANAGHQGSDALYAESRTSSPAIHGNNTWDGSAGFFENYSGSTNPVLKVMSKGEPGDGVFSQKLGHEGSAGVFWNSDIMNPSSAVFARTDGIGSALGGNGGAHGSAASFRIDSAANAAAAIYVINQGTGNGALIENINGGSTGDAVHVTTSATSTVSAGYFAALALAGSASAINATTQGLGSAIIASTNNSLNNSPTISSASFSTSAPAGRFTASQNGLEAFSLTSGDGILGSCPNAYAGTGSAVHGQNLSPHGYAGFFELRDSTNSSFAVNVFKQGKNGAAMQIVGGQGLVVSGSSSPIAVQVYGGLNVLGNLTKSSGTFRIDHPLDPANKYLSHSFVESPDMMNIYNGNVTLDENGDAWVLLPDWFEALNKDFRYQLTCIGGFAPVYVAEKVTGNRFKISGGHAGLEVSWQVTGVRRDPYANAHRVQVEVEKAPEERGRYLYPELYGQPPEKGVSASRNSEEQPARTGETLTVSPH